MTGTYKWDGSTAVKSREPEADTFETRFKRALSATRKQGVKVKQNVRECCRSCVGLEKLGLEDWESPFVWTFGGQGSAYRWEDGVPMYYGGRWDPADSRVKRIYFNHGGPGVEGAAILTKALRDEGITVDWDGSEGKCPEVVTPYGLENES